MKAIKIGIMLQEQNHARVSVIARGDFKPRPSEPKTRFTSRKSLAEILSDDNRALLNVIRDTRHDWVSSLAAATGRKPGNVSHTLKTMSHYGIVKIRRDKKLVRPIAKATEFQIVTA